MQGWIICTPRACRVQHANSDHQTRRQMRSAAAPPAPAPPTAGAQHATFASCAHCVTGPAHAETPTTQRPRGATGIARVSAPADSIRARRWHPWWGCQGGGTHANRCVPLGRIRKPRHHHNCCSTLVPYPATAGQAMGPPTHRHAVPVHAVHRCQRLQPSSMGNGLAAAGGAAYSIAAGGLCSAARYSCAGCARLLLQVHLSAIRGAGVAMVTLLCSTRIRGFSGGSDL
jgi:hypothetical protein